MQTFALNFEGEKTMKRSLSIKILVLTMTLVLGSLAVSATERAFSATGRGIGIFVTDAAGNVIAADAMVPELEPTWVYSAARAESFSRRIQTTRLVSLHPARPPLQQPTATSSTSLLRMVSRTSSAASVRATFALLVEPAPSRTPAGSPNTWLNRTC